MAMAMSPGPGAPVVVWCFQSHKRLFPFEPSVSNYIEKKDSRPINKLLTVDHLCPQFKYHEIDLTRQLMTDTTSGSVQAIKRRVFQLQSLYADNATWQFQGDQGEWFDFDITTAQLIEDTVVHGGQGIKQKNGGSQLNLHSLTGLPYIIDLKSECQRNVHTNKVRKIRRSILTTGYTIDSTSSPSIAVITRQKRKTAKAKAAPKEAQDMPCRVSYPVEKLVTLEELKDSNSDTLEVFLTKFTKQVVMNSGGATAGAKCVWDDDDDDSKKDDKEGEEEEECQICLGNLSGVSGYEEDHADSHHVVQLINCQHMFHKLCIAQMYKSCDKDGFLECPSCKHVYGEKVGNCPNGTMEWKCLKTILPGHEDCKGAIEVTYTIRRGVQTRRHPNPGSVFISRGFPRTCYLPDSSKGRLVLNLLIVAFKRRLMFTIGTSATTGESNTVIWNDIHHKTEATSNRYGHGYPDHNYLDNVLMELAAQGVTQDCLDQP